MGGWEAAEPEPGGLRVAYRMDKAVEGWVYRGEEMLALCHFSLLL